MRRPLLHFTSFLSFGSLATTGVRVASSLLSYIFVTVLFITLLPATGWGQIPGFIIQKATNGGSAVLDPNKDGYVSKTAAGFNVSDRGADYSEINYNLFPQVATEPHSDLKTGGSTNFTDLMENPWYAYFDGTNLLFRVRVGANSSASKGFSVLVDSDKTFAGTGTNPGFEYEILLATNFDVRIINLTNNAVIYTASYLSNSQRSVALTNTNGNPDYFIDYFVPLAGFNGAITAASPLRLSGISVTSAQSGITGTAADIGGLNDLSYIDRNQAWSAAINSFTPTSLNDLLTGGFKPAITNAPFINGPIVTSDLAVTGTSTEVSGTIIAVYQNEILLGTTTVTASSTWSLTVAANTLTKGSTITAKAKNNDKSLSNASNVIIVGQAGQTGQVSCTSPPPVPTLGTIQNNNKNISVTIPNTTTSSFNIRIFRITETGPVLVTTSPSLAAATTSWSYTGTLPSNGEYYADAVYVNNTSCISARSNSQCTGNSTKILTAPNFVTTNILAATTSITITTTANTYNTLFADNIQIAGGTATGTSYTFSNLTLKTGQVLRVAVSASGSCGTNSASVTVGRIAPVIIGSYCAVSGGSTLTFTGTGTEIGSTIRMYNSAGTQLTPTTTVNSNGVWSIVVSGVTPGNYYVRSTAADGTGSSVNSNTITVTSQTATTGLTINAPINESTGSNGSVSGNAPAGSAVKVYIDGSLLGTTTALSNGTWSLTGLSSLELYLGGYITATVTSGGTCESTLVNGTAVICSVSPAAVTATFGAATLAVCNEGTVTATISNSEENVAYQLTLGGVATGNVTMGNGSTIIVASGPITAAGTLRIVARKNFTASCQTTLSASATVSLRSPIPAIAAVSATATQVCFNASTTISVTSVPEANDIYQLKKNGVVYGSEVTYKSGTLTFNTGAITASTSFTVVHKNASGCTATSNAVTVSPQGPSNKQSVSVNKNSICINETVTISVATEYSATPYTYRVFQSLAGATATQVGSDFTGNGLVKSVTTPALDKEGIYTYTVQAFSGTCNVVQVQSQTVSVGLRATVATVGSPITTCSAATLSGNQPEYGRGTWTIKTKPVNAPDPVFSDINQPNATVMGLMAGNYVFRWTISQTCVSNNLSNYAELTVYANCPLAYNVNSPYYINGYETGDELAIITNTERFDPKSTGNFKLVAGTLPNGVSLNPTTGTIYVSNSNLLSKYKGPYTFDLTVSATDAAKVVTNIPVTISFYPEASATSIYRTPVVLLPVELIYFTGKYTNGEVQLVWATATEKDNKYFQVERSTNGTNFQIVGQVAGAGNSIQVEKYTFSDSKAPQGTVYYRLKQVDYADTFIYSKIVAVKNKANIISEQLIAYPNPTNNKMNLAINAATPGAYTIEVRDLTGKLLLVNQVNLDSKSAETNLDLQLLPAGTYLVTARSAEKQLVTRIIKN